MKQFLKRRLTYSDIFLILVNLVPVVGVWYNQWDAPGVFIVYCLESVIAGLYNIIMMFITTLVKKKDVWQNGSATAIVSGYGFIAFFVVHYGFFVWLQMGIFLGISGYMNYSFGPSNVFDFFVHLLQNIPLQLQWLLLLFIVSYGLMVLKTFILTGIYKTASLGVLMFAPYARVFVQQFCVIIGGIFLQFGAGRYFILVFAVVKIFFDTILDYEKIISVSAKSAV
ncbi:MAG TPA: DUF6498-containing protein [Chitinophagaceae bacterium]|nr:DUF6498-containing protein [Chitinophagaceae bacterium]